MTFEFQNSFVIRALVSPCCWPVALLYKNDIIGTDHNSKQGRNINWKAVHVIDLIFVVWSKGRYCLNWCELIISVRLGNRAKCWLGGCSKLRFGDFLFQGHGLTLAVRKRSVNVMPQQHDAWRNTTPNSKINIKTTIDHPARKTEKT